MNNKFNIGDDVRTLRDYYFDLENGKYALLKGIELRIAIITVDGYGFENYDITLFIPEHDLELIEPNTIEEDTQKINLKCVNKISVDNETVTIDISKGCDNLTDEEKEVLDNFKGFDKIDVDSLKIEMVDYQSEYNKLLEEHEQTKELLEIAKIALKLMSELI